MIFFSSFLVKFPIQGLRAKKSMESIIVETSKVMFSASQKPPIVDIVCQFSIFSVILEENIISGFASLNH